MTPGEQRLRYQAYNEAREGAAWLETKSRFRRKELCEAHRSLLRILSGASRRVSLEPNSETAWNALAYVHREVPLVRAELAILEESPARRLFSFLSASEEERAEQIAQVLFAGGIRNWEKKFIGVEY